MDCKRAIALIQGAVDGRLSAAEAADLERHAAVCARCEKAHRAHRELARMLEEMPVEAPSDRFSDRVVARLVAAGVIGGAQPVRRRRWLGLPVRVPVFAAVLLMLGLALFPATIQPLTGFVGKGAVALADALFAAKDRVADTAILLRFVQGLREAAQTAWTVLEVVFSLVATVGEVFMLPALATILMITLGITWYVRAAHRRGAQNASFSF